MTISRRNLMKAGLAAGSFLAMPPLSRAQNASTPAAGRTARIVMGAMPPAFDPIFSGSNPTLIHSLVVYDTLFAPDDNGVSRPQMVDKWSLSDDKKTYTFTLRDGLGWHDGTAVTAADCVASIRRWGSADPSGKLIMERAGDISKKDDKTFVITLKEPLALLTDLMGSVSNAPLIMMRERDASRPSTEQVTANIGSGPYKFNQDLAKPGSSFTYDRNERYVPRQEPASRFAGGKVVKLDRLIWENVSDQQTALSALQAGEIDLLQLPPVDFYAAIQSDPNLTLATSRWSAQDFFLRMNFLQKPFDNVKARQAMLHLVNQDAFLQLLSPDPTYSHPLISMFGNETPYSNDANTGWFKKGGDPERAKQLFQEAGYAGEKVVILAPTDWEPGNISAQLLASQLQKIGVNAELAASEWAGVAARRMKKTSVEEGGWSIFITNWPNSSIGDPIGNPLLTAAGDKSWYGWPTNAEYEALRAKWADTTTMDDRKALARQMQQLWWDFVGVVFIGSVNAPIAYRKSLSGILLPTQGMMPLWNIEKRAG
ncbi:ABC transporter substrate-binding protein [Labrys okinawensis]|uniref:ABC transporter substrate-binding protein n=1 Tax=Labrys okinawensis TaxID=346911 RepID=UPI0039BCA1A7